MNILHYTIGLPPIRRGGSVQYAFDLMQEQSKSHNAFALTCGDTLFRSNKAKIKANGSDGKIKVFILTNPLTPTLIYGTSEPDKQHRNIQIDQENIRNFIQTNNIEVMHLHTLQGIHKSFVEFVKSLGVKIIYTTHDFHGICPHYNLINQTGELCKASDGKMCAICNQNEPSDLFLRIANSKLYHLIKETGVLKLIKRPSTTKVAISNEPQYSISACNVNGFEQLLEYYKNYFALVDIFHFNSQQTRNIFQCFIPFADGKTIPVVTSGIKDNRAPRKIKDTIKFGYIGSLNDYKGFPLLKKVLSKLYNQGLSKFKLLAYAGTYQYSDPDCPFIEYQPPYKYSEISKILYNIDCIIVPSKCYETFSLVTLEALSHGIPVIVSDHVGAKDIVRQYGQQYVFSNYNQLINILFDIISKPELLEKYNRLILNKDWDFSIEKHSEEIIKMYNSI